MASSDCSECSKVRLKIAPNARCENHIDIYKDTSLRYLGYANEVGESFRPLIPVSVVNLSYVIASGYVLAHAVNEGYWTSKRPTFHASSKGKEVTKCVADTVIWQGFASVAVPGFTINRVCALSAFLLKRSSSLPPTVRKWTTTCIGLASIPFIIKPIDHGVEVVMNKTIRRLYMGSDS
ncbi:mitochondrial fission process protein 1-like [Lineus longissimus]|uniref:mitochondrial fission process protein 1-like n=1 Tax=Lineus longissimus TaxID=88925 RepID=UPI00315C839E